MSLYQEFQTAIQAGQLREALLIAFSNNLELKITTSLVSSTKNQSYSWHSQLNLVEGLETKVSRELVDDNYQNLYQFHAQQIERAYQIWDKNRATLSEVLQLLAGIPISPKSGEREKKLFSLDTSDLELETETSTPEAIPVTPAEEFTDNKVLNLPFPTDNLDSEASLEEDYGDLLDDIQDEETTTETTSASSASVAIDDDEDWGEWLEEGDLPQNASNPNLDEMDWEDEENWQDFAPNQPRENVSPDK